MFSRRRPKWARVTTIAAPAIGGAVAGYPQGGWAAATGGLLGAVIGTAGDRTWNYIDTRASLRASLDEALMDLASPASAGTTRGVFDLLVASRRTLPFKGRQAQL